MMYTIIDIWVVIGFFVLRIGLPVAVIAMLAYGLKRLDRRWEAEARAQSEAMADAQPAAPRPARPANVDMPGKQVPFDPGFVLPPAAVIKAASRPSASVGGASQPAATPGRPAAPTGAPNRQAAAAGPGAARRCSDVRGCSESQRAQCPATAHPELPCWEARLQAERQMPQQCFDCEIFKNYPRV